MTARAGHSASGTWIFLALGGLLVLAIAYLFVPHRPRPADGASSALQGPAIESLIPAAPLPRDEVVLRWTATAGATYAVSVTDEQGRDLQNARNLQQPEFRVPAPAFAGLPASSPIVWRVGVSLPNGSKITSREFHAVVQ